MTTRRKCRAGCTDPRPLSGSGSATQLAAVACVRVYVPTCARRIMRERARACPRFDRRRPPLCRSGARPIVNRSIGPIRADPAPDSTRRGGSAPPLSLSLSRHASRDRSLGPFSTRFEFQSLVSTSYFLFSFLLFSFLFVCRASTCGSGYF